jgi:hypothetical protein
MTCSESVKRITSDELPRQLAFELDAMGTVSGFGFHSPKAPLSGQFPRPNCPASGAHAILRSDYRTRRAIYFPLRLISHFVKTYSPNGTIILTDRLPYITVNFTQTEGPIMKKWIGAIALMLLVSEAHADNGVYQIVAQNSRQCATTAIGAQIIQWPCGKLGANPGNKYSWGANQGIMWGIGALVPDMPMSASQQIAAIQSLLLKSVRVWCSVNGYHNPRALAPPAQAAGIIPVVLIEATPTRGAGEAANYANGYKAAQTCVLQTGVEMNIIYEAGNELDNWVGTSGDGSDISQYNRSNYIDARGLIRGMIDGVRALNSQALLEVHNAGWCHYGFMTGLWKDGVRWDITGEHWYGNEGDLLKAGCENGINILKVLHSSFGKPIIVTENNVNAGPFTKAQMASYFQNEMPELDAVAKQYDLESVDIFFLQDIPNFLTFGVYNGDGSKSEAYPVISNYLQAHPSVQYQIPPPTPRGHR